MLENSKLIDGQQGRTLEELCKKYNDASIQMSDLKITKDNAGTEIKKICTDKGTWETINYIVSMTRIEDKVSLDTVKVETYIKENYPNIWEELSEKCMKESKGYLKLNYIKPKTNI